MDDNEFVTSGDEHDPFDPADTSRAQVSRKQLVDEEYEKVRKALLRRQEAYQRVFKGAPMDGDMDIVIEDLRRFCRGDASTFNESERLHVLLTGRQEVYLRIMDHTRLSFDTLYDKYNPPPER